MKKMFCFLVVVLVNITLRCNAEIAIKTPAFNQAQTKQIQEIARDYIINNPDILLEAGKKLQEQEEAKEKAKIEKTKSEAAKYKKEIFATKIPGRVVLGNPNGRLIVAEFTQYQCPHCKAIVPIIDKLLKNDPNIQFILIYWPFFGNDAVYAAEAALAAQKQNKFNELNQAMWAAQSFINKAKVDDIIKTIAGLDAKKLHVDMGVKEIEAGLKANFKLAQDLGLVGAPTFIFTNQAMTKFSLISGQTPNFENDFKHSLDEVR